MGSQSPVSTRIVSFNANGIRSAHKKGFFHWMEREAPDVVCVQETKAQEHQLTDEVFHPTGYHCVYNDAERKGYSGTAIYSRVKPRAVTTRLGWEPVDGEGRYLQCDYADLSVISLYVPSGTSSEAALEKKFVFMKLFFEHLKALKRKRREFIICADWNTCHQAIDLRNWRANQKNSGFLPEERAWLDQIYAELGFVDSFRVVDREPDRYTWWSNRGQAWAKNVGWRLDYQMITPKLVPAVLGASIYTDERFSDHAPQVMEYALEIKP
ncbi:MAG: exodeoxyribonuclease III [Congregibacter sp.]|nr:exodeoxyribonuclease III [Congregibacter sp.]